MDKSAFIDKDGYPGLTEKGKKRLANFELDEFAIIKPKNWDSKFRIIIFDIAITKNRIRREVREQLIKWGLARLQNSVWVHPYECEEIIALLKSHFGVVKDIVYITAEKIENDGWLKKKFGLNTETD